RIQYRNQSVGHGLGNRHDCLGEIRQDLPKLFDDRAEALESATTDLSGRAKAQEESGRHTEHWQDATKAAEHSKSADHSLDGRNDHWQDFHDGHCGSSTEQPLPKTPLLGTRQIVKPVRDVLDHLKCFFPHRHKETGDFATEQTKLVTEALAKS